ncbi:MAG: hypothetical protein QOG82_1482 [Actinomycetota bacterium]|jgi:hypothetical protein|nr:hypothetical protein [Actinomycetota bacterium]
MSTEGPVFRSIGPDGEYIKDDTGDEAVEGAEGADLIGGKVLTAVIGPGPDVLEILTYASDGGESVTHRVTSRPITLAAARNQAINYATDMWFDAVVMLSGPRPPWPIAARLWAVAQSDPDIALVTGLEPAVAGRARDWAAGPLAAEFGTEAIDIPATSPECMLVVLSAVRRIDRFDLNYKSGSEIDWAARVRKAGLRVVAAPAVPLGGPATAPPQGMVLFRHPSLIKDQRDFWASGAIEAVQARSAAALVRAAARTIGYTVEVTSQPRPMITHDPLARVSVRPERAGTVDVRFAGLQATLDLGEGDAPDLLEVAFGRPAERVVIYEQGEAADRLLVWEFMGVPIDDRSSGPPAP